MPPAVAARSDKAPLALAPSIPLSLMCLVRARLTPTPTCEFHFILHLNSFCPSDDDKISGGYGAVTHGPIEDVESRSNIG